MTTAPHTTAKALDALREAPGSHGAPLVVAVVLTWDDTELAARCIQSVLENDYRSLRVVLVDNGSASPCGSKLQQQFPSIEVVALPVNQGFTGGSNRGLERALELAADYVFLLNNDTIVDSKAISTLVAALEQRTDAGAATALLLLPGEEKRVGFYTGTIERDCAMHDHQEVNTPVASRDWPTVETEFAPACALLFRAAALREVGLFDERLGTNWEDYDLCVRFKDAGWPMLAVGNAQVVHLHGATTGRNSPYITYYYARNRLICLARYGRPWGILRRSLYILRSFYWQVRSYGFANWACHAAFVRGVVDFALGIRHERRVLRERNG